MAKKQRVIIPVLVWTAKFGRKSEVLLRKKDFTAEAQRAQRLNRSKSPLDKGAMTQRGSYFERSEEVCIIK